MNELKRKVIITILYAIALGCSVANLVIGIHENRIQDTETGK